MDSIKNSKSKSILVITVIYVLAAALGVAVYKALPLVFWIRLLIADVAATIFVFVFSVIFKNASVYDPYWSVQPIVIIAGYALTSNITPATLLLIISIVYWGIRLVFVIRQELRANIGSFIGMVVCVGAATLQLVADTQMQKYRKSGQHGLIRTGLWKYARHPNYLGEILMWWGIAIQAVSVMPSHWWLAAGAVANTILFFTVSIPLADKRQSAKPGYAEYKAGTRSLLPIPKG